MTSASPSAPDFSVETLSSHPFDETVEGLKQAIQNTGFLLVHEINSRQILEKHGIQIANLKQLFYFRPDFMKRLLELNSRGILLAPLKFVVMEMPDKRVKVLYASPTRIFRDYKGLETLGLELEKVVLDICRSIAHSE